MALIKCPECGHQISDTAESCPHCGKPLKGKNKIKILEEDAVIAGRKTPSLFAPIFWLIFFIAFFTLSIVFFPETSFQLLIALYVLAEILLLGPIIAFLFTLISRARNNSKDKPVIVYRNATDSFEIIHLNNKVVTIKRSAVTRVETGVTTVVYWKDSHGKINRVKAAYCDDSLSIKAVFNKYIEFH